MGGTTITRALRNWLITGFSAAVLMFCAASWLTYQSTKALISAQNNVSATHRILEQIAHVRLLLDDAESSSLGFALSGREDYLQPYESARAQIDVAIQILKHDLSSRSAQLQVLLDTEPLIAQRLQVTEQLIIARREHGPEAAMNVVRTGRGKNLTDEITRRLLLLQIDEQNLLLEGSKTSDRQTRIAVYYVGAVSVLGLGLLALALFFISRSFHQREALRAELAQKEQIQRTILDSANYSIISTDASGLITTVNATAQNWLRGSAKALLGKNLTILHDAEELESHAKELTKSAGEPVNDGFAALITKASRGMPEEVKWTYVRMDGTRFPVSASMTALRRRDGTIDGYLAIANDLSSKQAIEKMKDDFVSIVSHELRTPLTAIRGSLGLLAGGAMGSLPERAVGMVDTALRNTERLARLTNDILDLARIEAGRMPMQKKRTDARELMAHSAELVQALAKESGVSISVHSEPVCLDADPDRMVQAFSNLLTNAIKFSPAGATIEFESSQEGNAILFRVKDQGRGIPKEKLETIFGRFEQVDPSDSRDRGGTGLGLAICRSIVEQHRGKIWAESDTGKGSTFFIRLPLESQNQMPGAALEGDGNAETYPDH